jgi:hypothetical protein
MTLLPFYYGFILTEFTIGLVSDVGFLLGRAPETLGAVGFVIPAAHLVHPDLPSANFLFWQPHVIAAPQFGHLLMICWF